MVEEGWRWELGGFVVGVRCLWGRSVWASLCGIRLGLKQECP